MAKQYSKGLFRHVGRIASLEVLNRGLVQKTDDSNRLARWLLPTPKRQRLQTYYQNLRYASRAYNSLYFSPPLPATGPRPRRAGKIPMPGGVTKSGPRRRDRAQSPGHVPLRQEILRYLGPRNGTLSSGHQTRTDVRAGASVLALVEKRPSGVQGPASLCDPADLVPTTAVTESGVNRLGLLQALRARELVGDQRQDVASRVAQEEKLQMDVNARRAELAALEQNKEEDQRSIRRLQRWLVQVESSLKAHRTSLQLAQRRLSRGGAKAQCVLSQLLRNIPGDAELTPSEDDSLRDMLFDSPKPEIGPSEPSEQIAAPQIEVSSAGEQPQSSPPFEDPGGEVAEEEDAGNDLESAQAKTNRPGQCIPPQAEAPTPQVPVQDWSMLPAIIRPIFERLATGLSFHSALVEAREVLVNQYFSTQEAFESNRDNYYEMRAKHQTGQDPGLPGWSPSWNIEEFDHAHLREWMRLSSLMSTTWTQMLKHLRFTMRAGIEPLPWEESGFWQPGSIGYGSEAERGKIEGAPVEKISNWRSSIPRTRGNLLDNGLGDMYDEIGLEGALPVEWPTDEQIYDSAPELLPDDSWSARALEYDVERNTKYAGPRAEGWTLTRPETWQDHGEPKPLNSHMM